MKLIQISFKNINNLKGGPHIISFDQLPLKNAGIFAIIGPTGSGKSTILDVITLALFNQIPRFKSKVSLGELSKLGSVITHFTDEAEASVTYEIKENRYTSKWSISKNRNGKLRDYEMDLSDASGAILDLKKSEIPAKNEDIIGLKYDQFIKAIILSQGEFSKFLKANKNDRGKLLENITDTGIYRKLGAATFEKFNNLKKEVTLEKENLSQYSVMSHEEKTAHAEQIKISIQQKTKIDTDIKRLQSDINLKKLLLEKENLLSNKKHNELELEKKFKTFAPSLIKLERHDQVSPLHSEIKLYENATHKCQSSEANISTYLQNLGFAQESIASQLTEVSELVHNKVDRSNFDKKLTEFENIILELDFQLKGFESTGSEIRSRINSRKNKLGIQINEKIKPNEAIQILDKYNIELLRKINLAGWSTETQITQYQNELNIDRDNFENWKEFGRVNKALNELIEKERNELVLAAENEEIIRSQKPLIKKTQEKLNALDAHKTTLLQRKEDALLIASLTELRATLKPHEPCPLCGSEEHPFEAHGPIDKRTQIEKEIEDLSAQVKQETEHLSSVQKTFLQAETTHAHNLDFIKKNKTQIKTAEKEIEICKDKLNLDENFNQKTIGPSITSLETNILKKEIALHAIRETHMAIELINEFKKLEKVLHNYSEKKEKRLSLYSGENISEKCVAIKESLSKQKTLETENTVALKYAKEDLLEAQKLVKHSVGELQPHLKKFGFSSITQLHQILLSEKDYVELKENYEQLLNERNTLKLESNALFKEIEQMKLKNQSPELSIDQAQNTLSNQESLRDSISIGIGKKEQLLQADGEILKIRNQKEKRLKKLSRQYEKWAELNILIGDKEGNKFSNFAQGLTLQNLLSFTNKRLLKLSDRYLIDKPKDDGELTIIDQYQGNSTRSVSTLSGGETFLVSLALALSLSDMASKNISLDSLFIDEGFGTLDQETLDIAMDTLERLQTESQKTVGIISHVSALKERIHVQIQLNKNALGYSTIEMIG